MSKPGVCCNSGLLKGTDFTGKEVEQNVFENNS